MTVYIVYGRHWSARPTRLAICLTLGWAEVMRKSAALLYDQSWIETTDTATLGREWRGEMEGS